MVTDDSRAEEGIYKVTNADGKKHTFERHRIHHGQRHIVAIGYITNDTIYD